MTEEEYYEYMIQRNTDAIAECQRLLELQKEQEKELQKEQEKEEQSSISSKDKTD